MSKIAHLRAKTPADFSRFAARLYFSHRIFNAENLTLQVSPYQLVPIRQRLAYNLLFLDAFGFSLEQYEKNWAYPQYFIGAYIKKRLVCGYFAIIRRARINEKEITVAGLGGLVCHQHLRGRGLASRMLKNTWLTLCQNHHAELGLLICSGHNISFYQSLGWKICPASIEFEETRQTRSFHFNTMYLPNTHNSLSKDDVLDLQGKLW